MENNTVDIIGAGLAGTEAALQLAQRGIAVRLFEMRPLVQTDVHRSGNAAELVCSNSLKSTKPDSAAGMLKHELSCLGSYLISFANETRVAAGGALAVDRDLFSQLATDALEAHPLITRVNAEVVGLGAEGEVLVANGDGSDAALYAPADAVIVASGPLTSDRLAAYMQKLTGQGHLAFYDAAAPVVMADSLDRSKVFSQSRYEDGGGDYLNAPFGKEEYERFMEELVAADRVIKREFETADLFQACQLRCPSLWAVEARWSHRSGNRAPSLGGSSTTRRRYPRAELQFGRLPDQPHVFRAKARIPNDSWP